MQWWVLIAIGIGLALDAFAVAVGVSTCLGGTTRRQTFRLVWHFALFQSLMPILGWAGGLYLQQWVRAWDHWLAFVLLAVVGGRMILEGLADREVRLSEGDPTRGWSLVLLSVATSIDALAVGLSFAALDVVIWVPAAVIGVVTAAITAVGTAAGRWLGSRMGRRAGILGGTILILIGLKILLEHLAGA